MCAFVDKHRDEHGVEPICKALQIAPSTYYARRSRPESARAVSDRELGEKIECIHAGNYGVYGARKVHKELHRQDIPAARCTVERLMRQKGLRGISRSKGPRTTRQARGSGRAPVSGGSAQPVMGCRHHVCPHVCRLGLRGVCHRRVLPQDRSVALPRRPRTCWDRP
ncbi:hypothetical protein D7003_11555 [Arthrobacter oryzae]|uniref:HTH-like domain-containing protein n=1 Tax=Arthrobacter oryzae TaxID=409290 RepID=A0A3N0BX88_9MICC|nr:hypothetical protein D7003_11555 [Arthrobacter oryzae]